MAAFVVVDGGGGSGGLVVVVGDDAYDGVVVEEAAEEVVVDEKLQPFCHRQPQSLGHQQTSKYVRHWAACLCNDLRRSH